MSSHRILLFVCQRNGLKSEKCGPCTCSQLKPISLTTHPNKASPKAYAMLTNAFLEKKKVYDLNICQNLYRRMLFKMNKNKCI